MSTIERADMIEAAKLITFNRATTGSDKTEAIEIAHELGIPVWEGRAELRKFEGDSTDENDLYEVTAGTPNLLVYGGASALWHRLTGGTTVTAFNNTNAYIGVGDSTTAAANTQTALSASTNLAYLAMDSGYPAHTDGTGSGSASVQFRATAATGTANFAWNEWALFNANTSGRMLQRKVESLGTKTSSSTWQLLVTLSLS